MRHLILIFTLKLLVTSAYSQQQSNDVVVEGAAKMKIRPDIVVFTLTIEKRDTSEKQAIFKLNSSVSGLEKALNQIGISSNAVRIVDFDVTSSYNDDHRRKNYIATNILKLEFQIEKKLINAIYTQIQKSGIEDLDIEYDVKLSDSLEKAGRNKLVQLAIADAKTNAANIASSLDMKLGKVRQVQNSAYGLLVEQIGSVKFTAPKVVPDKEIKYRTSFDRFEIEDIELEERITVVYSIAAL
jgi:uncharacterized protein YggE